MSRFLSIANLLDSIWLRLSYFYNADKIQAGMQEKNKLTTTIQNDLATTRNELISTQNELISTRNELVSTQNELMSTRNDFLIAVKGYEQDVQLQPSSQDRAAWRHPFLTEVNIRSFREYSNSIWDFARDYAYKRSEPLKIAFLVNMAQNMYKWAMMAQRQGAVVELFPLAWDKSAIGAPEWEEYDGEWPDIYDGPGFLKANPGIRPEVPCRRILIEAYDFYDRFNWFLKGTRKPLLNMLVKAPSLRHELMMSYQKNRHFNYFHWAEEVAKFDVAYGTSSPLAAYFSGKPYCVFSCGHDVEDDIGRGDQYGQVMNLCYNAAKFLMISNPHTLGHSRRLGLTNGLYMPYPMDDRRYCPGQGNARDEWEATTGGRFFVLMTARLDPEVKGQDEKLFDALIQVTRQRPATRFVFLGWGEGVSRFRDRIATAGVSDRFFILSPVGKKRLIEYYRSCDVVVDQFLYGYYGVTALEAAAVGKPVVMRLRTEHLDPLYSGDVMPALNCSTAEEVTKALISLCDDQAQRLSAGENMRAWLLRNHGEEKTMPMLMALLRLTADQVPLPLDLVSPLWAEETDEEKAYHQSCLIPNQ
jgi:glycosyltransferase involved in cell wall biosynthesis